MEKVVWTLVVAVAVCVTWTSAQSAVWNRRKDGLLHVSLADIPGVHNVTVTVQGDVPGRTSAVYIPHVSGDKTWKAIIPDMTKNDVISYIIDYELADTVHRVTGSHSFQPTQTAMVPLNSERYLQRRATTVFFDDFSSGHVDPHKWSIDVQASGLSHFEIFSPEHANLYVKNGLLFIKPTLTIDHFGNNVFNHGTIDTVRTWGRCDPKWGGGEVCTTHAPANRPTMSASIRSKAHVKYGKVEVVAKMAKGDWVWPAIWMMPVHGTYGPWPASGEIDIIETTGNLHLRHPGNGDMIGPDRDKASVGYGNGRVSPAHKAHRGVFHLGGGRTFAGNFHKFWLDWTHQYIKLGVDEHVVLALDMPSEGFYKEGQFTGHNPWAHAANNAPFDQPFYLILDVAVGGDYFWHGYVNEPYPRPWTADGPPQDIQQFWAGRNHWLPTWHGEDVAMRIQSVKMQQY